MSYSYVGENLCSDLQYFSFRNFHFIRKKAYNLGAAFYAITLPYK